MKRALALGAVLACLALAGCGHGVRGAAGTGGGGGGGGTATPAGTAAPATTKPVAPPGADLNGDIASLDSALSTVDNQIAQADQSTDPDQ